MRLQQPIIGHAKIARGKQLLAILIVLERAGFSDQGINHVPIVDRSSTAADQSRHPLDEHPLVRDLDELGRDLDIHLLTDQPTRHRIAVRPHANCAALRHADARKSFIGVQPMTRQAGQELLFLGKAPLTMLVRLGDQVLEETQIVFATRKVSAAAEHQRLIDPVLEVAV